MQKDANAIKIEIERGVHVGDWEVGNYLGKGYWNCTCLYCGTEKRIDQYRLSRDKAPRCTCQTGKTNKGKIDMTGKQYGEWTVLSYAGNGKWTCRCSCGTVRNVPGQDLRNGSSKSCGHFRAMKIQANPEISGFAKVQYTGNDNLADRQFGEWHVLYFMGNGMWLCKCSCGKLKAVNGLSLRDGRSTSCGHNTTGFKDLTGKYFGQNNQVQAIEWIGGQRSLWKCRCKCGNEFTSSAYSLIHGITQSCGCLTTENRFKTNIQKYGYIMPDKGNENRTKEQLQMTSSPENVENAIKSLQNKNNGVKPTIPQLADYVGLNRGTVNIYLKRHNMLGLVDIANNTSKYELEINNMLVSTHYLHRRDILDTGKEIDIYLPDKKTGIEFNGNYFHSEEFKDEYYHQDKVLDALKKDIRLINIFEYEWTDERTNKILKSIIKSIDQPETNRIIHARDCEVRKISDENLIRNFLQENHLQGYIKAVATCGLFYNNELVGLMSFGKPRFSAKYQAELLRLAFKLNTIVVGGANKMFKYACDAANFTSVISYCDLSKFSGKVYTDLGFINDGITEPNYVWWQIGCNIIPRYRTTKQSLIDKGYGKYGSTETEIMHNLGYVRIYNCGNARYIWQKKEQNKL